MLLFAAGLSVVAGALVALFGQERRVRWWFLVLCAAAAGVTTGLWIEINVPEHAFLAARLNMSTAIVLVLAACTCALIMCGARWNRFALAALGVATVLVVATVWASDLYFTGEYVDYGWGGYVVASDRFAINPILVAAVGLYTVVSLALRYPRAHPLDRNRILYVVLAWLALAASMLDYLPHFGIDLFGGPVSAITIPVFLAVFGYAILRVRLVEFRAIAIRTSGWLVTLILVATVYLATLEAAGRWLDAEVGAAHVGAAIAGLVTFSAAAQAVPGWLRRLAGAGERDYQDLVDAFSDRLRGVQDEPTMRIQLEQTCTGPLGAATVALLDAAELRGDAVVAEALERDALIEAEVLRRRGLRSPLLDRGEVIVPLRQREALLGALLLGPRADGGMYPRRLLDAARTIANVFTVSVAGARSSVELEHRHQLDRYLPPQLVEHALQGQATALESRRRQVITIFFSDLKGFTAIADRLDPDVLSTILNHYLSEMSDVALEHGGTIDKFIGDAMMVLFGAPVDLDPVDQVERALEMALAMHERLTELNRTWRERGLLDRDLQVRMGLHTGEATVGSFGSRVRADYTAVGRAVNLASRLESACPPGRILLSASTWQLVRSRLPVRAEPRGELTVKGFAAPVEVVEIDPAGLREATGERRFGA